MVGLRGRPPRWDRFAGWPPGAAILAIAFCALLLAAAALTHRTQEDPAPVPLPSAELVEDIAGGDGGRGTGLALYDRIAERVAAGDDYYQAAVEEQRARDFPVRPGFAVRLPTLAYATAWLGQGGLLFAAILLGLATLVAWWRRLGDEPGGSEHRAIALLLLAIGAGIGFKSQYLALHEVWAGMFLALSFGLHRRGQWGAAWIAAALALSIREHALLFVLLMGALAWYRGDRREAAAWAGLVLVFLLALWLHLDQVSAHFAAEDRASPSWLALRGLDGWTSNIVLSSVLYLLRDLGLGRLAAPLALLPLLGWAGWKSDMGLFGFLLFAGYGLLFMFAGRDNDYYWALIITPVYFVGLVYLPRALRSLWNSARGY